MEQNPQPHRRAKDPNRKWYILLLLFCLAVLTRYILFKHPLAYYKHYFFRDIDRYTVQEGLRHANFKPFYTIKMYTSGRVSREMEMANIWGNILGFVPVGILLPLSFPFFRNFFVTLFSIFLLSLAFETCQLYLGLGVFDVDDLMLNTIGGVAGYMMYAVARLMRGPAHR